MLIVPGGSFTGGTGGGTTLSEKAVVEVMPVVALTATAGIGTVCPSIAGAVGSGVGDGSGVSVGSGVFVGNGVLVGSGVADGTGVSVGGGTDTTVGDGAIVGVGERATVSTMGVMVGAAGSPAPHADANIAVAMAALMSLVLMLMTLRLRATGPRATTGTTLFMESWK
jgi:hypothetical protein